QGLEVDLGAHALAVVPRLENLHGPLEVDVVDVAVLDLGVGRGVEWALAVFGCHRICWQRAVNTRRPDATSQRNPRARSRGNGANGGLEVEPLQVRPERVGQVRPRERE